MWAMRVVDQGLGLQTHVTANVKSRGDRCSWHSGCDYTHPTTRGQQERQTGRGIESILRGSKRAGKDNNLTCAGQNLTTDSHSLEYKDVEVHEVSVLLPHKTTEGAIGAADRRLLIVVRRFSSSFRPPTTLGGTISVSRFKGVTSRVDAAPRIAC